VPTRVTNDVERQSLGAPEVTVPARPLFRDIQHLGEGIWLNEGKTDERVILIDGRPHIRFLDHMYLPAPTHALTAQQVVVINRYRATRTNSDPQFAYNRRIRRIFSEIASEVSGPILEVGPSFEPALGPDGSRVVLCDVDETVNAQNAAAGYPVIEPAFLSQYEDARFSLTIASFVFHFPIEPAEAEQLARTLAPSGLMMFNVLTKAASTRTHAVSVFSQFGLKFACVELEMAFGKDDVLFIGSKCRDTKLFQLAGRIIATAISRPGI
jgi:hypothetical protein